MSSAMNFPLLRFLAFFALGFLPVMQAFAEELVIPGSGNPEFIFGELAKAFNARQSAHQVVIPPSTGIAGALRDVGEGRTTLGRTGRPLTAEESAKGLTYIPVGREAVAVTVGAGVSVRAISSEQLVGVFSGKITNWSELCGKPAPIRAIGKESTDSIRRQISAVFKDLVYSDTIKIVHLDTYLIEMLDRYPTSFAIINRSAIGACKTKVSVLALDGVQPSIENVANGSYPLVVELGLVHKSSGLSPAGKAFIDFIRSPEGAKILQTHGVMAKGKIN